MAMTRNEIEQRRKLRKAVHSAASLIQVDPDLDTTTRELLKTDLETGLRALAAVANAADEGA